MYIRTYKSPIYGGHIIIVLDAVKRRKQVLDNGTKPSGSVPFLCHNGPLKGVNVYRGATAKPCFQNAS